MRIALVSSLAALAVACGGNVVVDSKTGGTGGSGGNATTSGTTSTTGSTTTTAGCDSSSCDVGSLGACSCVAFCEEQKRVVDCEPTPIGSSCSCWLNDIHIANCSETVPSGCDIFQGCCAAAFFGGQ